uniref:DUF4283 domain-containing protein n=1 Tax=Chenopodium quinoa TaxID=63459 RepID=A0A803MX09_CHEQI
MVEVTVAVVVIKSKFSIDHDISGNKQPSEVSFTRSPFWIHLEDVPFNRRKAFVANEVGESLGGFIEYDASDPLGYEKVMRIKVLLDIEKPLRRGLRIATGPSSSKWIGINRVTDSERIREANLLQNLKEKKLTLRPTYDDPCAIKLGPPGVAKMLLFETPEKLGQGGFSQSGEAAEWAEKRAEKGAAWPELQHHVAMESDEVQGVEKVKKMEKSSS